MSNNTENAGGIVGYIQGGKVINCRNEGVICNSNTTGEKGIPYDAGGIAGRALDGATIENCYNLGNVRAENAGGICGHTVQIDSEDVNITNCYNAGSVTKAKGSSRLSTTVIAAGGIFGTAATTSTKKTHITNCFFDITVNSGMAVVGSMNETITMWGCNTLATEYMKGAPGTDWALVNNLNGYREGSDGGEYPAGWREWEVVTPGTTYPTFSNPHAHKLADNTEIKFKPWTSTNSLPGPYDLQNGVGSFYLTDDVTLTSRWQIPPYGYNSPVTINLCLNGHKLDLGGQYITVQGGGTLNLYDCDTTTVYNGYIDGSTYLWTADASNAHNGQSDEYDITGGLITNGYVSAAKGVGQTGGSLTMNGGTIAGTSHDPQGGGVYVTSSSFTMNGGAIVGNKTNGMGGGVFVSGTGSSFTMNGGVISYNTAPSGGGVYVNLDSGGNCTFTMNDGAISNNRATDSWYGSGGGVLVKANCTFTMNGGTISGNTATYTGGGVNSVGTFTMKGGLISGNTSNLSGGGVFTSPGSSSNMKFTMTGGTITDNSAGTKGGGVFVGSNSWSDFGGTARITGNTGANDAVSNLTVSSGYISIGKGSDISAPKNGMLVGVNKGNGGQFTSNGSSGYEKYFAADDTTRFVEYSSGHLELTLITYQKAIKTEITGNGAVYASPQAVNPYEAAGATITVEVLPDEGWELESLKYNDGSDHDLTENGSYYTFTLPSQTADIKDVTVKATFIKSDPKITVKPTQGAANPVYGTAITTAAQHFDVSVLNFPEGVTPELKLQWKKGSGQTATWDGSAPTGVELGTDGKVKTSATTPAGEYVFRITNGLADDADGFVSSGEITLTVDKATPTITTAPTASAIVYGKAVSASQLTGGAATPSGGTFAWESTDAAVAPTVAQSGTAYTVVYTPTDTTNYNTATVEVAVTVNKYTPSITAWPTLPTTITYGDFATFGNITLTGGTEKESIDGTFGWADSFKNTEATVANGGTKTDPFVFTPTDTDNYNSVTGGGSVAVTIGAANYADTYSREASGKLKAKLNETVEITLPPIPTGASYGAVTNNNTGYFTVGTIDQTTGKVTVTSAKEWDKGTDGTDAKTFTVAVTPDGNHNGYTITVSVTPIYKTEVTISGLTAADAIYDGQSKTGVTGTAVCTANSSDVTSGCGTLVYTYYKNSVAGANKLAGKPVDAGSYVLVVSVPDANEIYTGSSDTIAFKIEKRTVTLIADSAEKVHNGEPLTCTTFTVKEDKTTAGYGFVGEEGIDHVTMTPESIITDVGSVSNVIDSIYPKVGTKRDNYDITLVNGTLTVLKNAQETPKKGEGFTLSGTTLTAESGYELFDGTVTATSFTIEEGKTYSIRKAGDTTHFASPYTAIDTTVTVNVLAVPSSMGTVTGSGKYAIGSNVTLTATPKDGYEFVEWQDVSGLVLDNDTSYTINSITTGQALIAAFQPKGKVVATLPTVAQPKDLVYSGTELAGIFGGTGWTLVEGNLEGTDAGVYSAKIKLKSGYDVWSDGTTGEKTIGWEIFKAPQAAPTGLSATENSITGVDNTMEYMKMGDGAYTDVTGAEITSLDPGTYYVRVKGSENRNPGPITVVIVSEPTLNVVTLQPSDLTSTSATLNGVFAPHKAGCAAKFLLKGEEHSATADENGIFSLAVTTLTPDTDYTVTAVVNNTQGSTVTFHTPKEEVPAQDDGMIQVNTTVEGSAKIIVSVERGNDVIASWTSSNAAASHKANFDKLPYGNYNVVVRTNNGHYTKTKMLSISAANKEVTVDFTVPKGKLAAVVDVKTAETPKTAVDGLGEILTTDDRNAAATGSKDVEVKLEVEKKAEAQATGATEIKKLLTESTGGNITVDFLDMSLLKTTTELMDDVPTSINTEDIGATNDKVLEIAVPYGYTGKEPKVLRYHNGMAEELTKLSARPTAPYMDGTYFIGDSYVFIYASGFSTYAIGYEESAPTSGGGASYSIGGANTENGKITLSRKNAAAGQTVTITVTPDTGYQLDKLTVLDRNGREIEVKSLGDNRFSFRMPSGKVTVNATFKAIEADEPVDEPIDEPVKTGICPQDETCVYAKFTDADTKAWYHDGVHYCVENGLMQGVSDTAFDPNGTLTRAQIVTILWRLDGKPVVDYTMSFADVPAGEWFAEAVRWAQSTGVVKGYSDEAFGPSDPITREQLAAILYRYAGYKGVDVSERADLAAFTDVSEISTWALDAMQRANAAQLVQGRTTTTLVPGAEITRAEAATMVQRFCENVLASAD